MGHLLEIWGLLLRNKIDFKYVVIWLTLYMLGGWRMAFGRHRSADNGRRTAVGGYCSADTLQRNVLNYRMLMSFEKS